MFAMVQYVVGSLLSNILSKTPGPSATTVFLTVKKCDRRVTVSKKGEVETKTLPTLSLLPQDTDNADIFLL